MDSKQDVDTWLAEIATRPSVFNHNLRLRAAEFKGFDLVNEVQMAAPNGAAEHVYLFAKRKARDETLLRVSLSTHDDTRHALLALHDVVDNSMNPDIARAPGKLAKLVDIALAPRVEREQGLAAASFSVGNVAVTVHSVGAVTVDVSAAAVHLGKVLGVAPDKATLKSERAKSFAPAGVELRAGQALTLVEQLPEARPGAERIQLIASDGEFRREGVTLVYVARSSGPQRIELFTHAQGSD
jgi:hypothetical protein